MNAPAQSRSIIVRMTEGPDGGLMIEEVQPMDGMRTTFLAARSTSSEGWQHLGKMMADRFQQAPTLPTGADPEQVASIIMTRMLAQLPAPAAAGTPHAQYTVPQRNGANFSPAANIPDLAGQIDGLSHADDLSEYRDHDMPNVVREQAASSSLVSKIEASGWPNNGRRSANAGLLALALIPLMSAIWQAWPLGI